MLLQLRCTRTMQVIDEHGYLEPAEVELGNLDLPEYNSLLEIPAGVMYKHVSAYLPEDIKAENAVEFICSWLTNDDHVYCGLAYHHYGATIRITELKPEEES